MDLKSNNVFINAEQKEVKELVVADFGIGISRRFHQFRIEHRFATPGVGAPEQFTTIALKTSDIYALGKLSIQIIFPWDTFWGIMGTPVDQSQIEQFRNADTIFKKFHDLVSSMLKVKWDTD